MSICDHDVDDEDVDEETVEQRREAADELEAVLDSLEAKADYDEGAPEPVEYVRYEGERYRISITNSVV
ncbi:hypothetical protein [Halosolutus halophilus]|uniref:hypothetical protein n=1 Tax=Halosolutus halophilus TaxID=1552990 RepID=UPI0022350F1B|nr:hypothetical protein [Halosolutus halophilus]